MEIIGKHRTTPSTALEVAYLHLVQAENSSAHQERLGDRAHRVWTGFIVGSNKNKNVTPSEFPFQTHQKPFALLYMGV